MRDVHLQEGERPVVNLVPEHIDVCSTCGYGAVKPNYPCYRCGQLGITRFVPLSGAEALATRAEKAEHDLRRFQAGLTDVLRVYNVPAMPSWPEAIHWLARHGRRSEDA